MNKEFLSGRLVRNNALKLAKRIFDDGFRPDVIYVSLRGGALMGNVFSEFFKLANPGARPVFYAAVVARSYTDIRQRAAVRIDGWTYDPSHLRNGDKVLFVDDIFDSGRTMNHLAECILQRGIPREDVKIAVHDYKIARSGESLPVHPDYWCRSMKADTAENDRWIHYLSHELEGLTRREIEHRYLAEDPELAEVFELIRR